MDSKENSTGSRTLVLGVIILGWVLCGYLVVRSMQLKTHTGSVPDLCNLFFGTSCDQTLSSPLSWHLGYPLAGWGLAYFGALGFLVSLRKLTTDRIVMLLAALGLGISIIQSALIIRGMLSCPLCLGIHLINLLVLILLVLNSQGFIFSSQQKLTTARRSIAGWSLLLLCSLIIGGVSEVGILRASVGKEQTVNLDEVAKQFQSETVHTIPKDDALPMLGSPDTKIQLVVFSSFQCPACKGFASSLKNIHKKFGNKIGITFKNFPLSTTCNPRMSVNMQPRSCGAAYAAYAAHRQNHFWIYHDQLFESTLEADEKTLILIAQRNGLNMKQWESDRQSETVKQKIAADVNLAYGLGVDATPTVFINGRRVSNFQEPALTFLIQNALNTPPN